MSNLPLSRRAALAGGASALACAAAPALAAPAARHTPGRALLDRLAWNLLELQPSTATSLGVDTGARAYLRARSEDRSAAGQRRLAARLKADLARVNAFNPAHESFATRTSLKVVQSAYRTALDGFALPYGDVAVGGWRNAPYAVIQNVGAYIDVPRGLESDQPVKTAADADAWLARLGSMAAQLDGERERIAAARAMGVIPPDFLLDKALPQLDRLIADAASAQPGLVKVLADKTAAIPGPWPQRAREILTTQVVPALHRQAAELRRQRALATGDPGLRERPHGEEWYAWALRASTTTSHSPAEIHRIGVAQLAELQARMDTILRALSLTQGTVAQRVIALQNDPRYAFPPTDAGRAQIVAYMAQKLALIRTRLPRAFRRLVPANLEITRLPLAEEAGAPPAYGGPGSIDGAIPSRIWVNLRDTSMHNRLNIPDLVFHEGIPGHVWQGEFARQQPLIRSILAFNAYSEGWALYAQQLADELGVYDDDPAGRLGYLQGMAWRAVRLIVDTGLHTQGWSRERALAEFTAATGLPAPTAASEIDRYCAWPGQACGYKMGQNEIIAQRTRAQTALGPRYDLRDFNQAVVDGGNVPLDVLAGNVSEYIGRAVRGRRVG